MAIGVASILAAGDNTPPASSLVTASATYTSGRVYFLWVSQIKGASIDPNFVTVTGASQTWTEITGARVTFNGPGTNRRISQAFMAKVTTTATGALTIGNLNSPDLIDWLCVEVTGVNTTTPYVVANLQTGSEIPNTADVLEENITMSAPASSNNRWLVFYSANTDSLTNRFETATDVGGEATWTLIAETGSSDPKARHQLAGWLNAAPANDLTPGVMYGATGFHAGAVFELNASGAVVTSGIQSINGVLYANVASVGGVLKASVGSINGVS